jgi:hypothetical protein
MGSIDSLSCIRCGFSLGCIAFCPASGVAGARSTNPYRAGEFCGTLLQSFMHVVFVCGGTLFSFYASCTIYVVAPTLSPILRQHCMVLVNLSESAIANQSVSCYSYFSPNCSYPHLFSLINPWMAFLRYPDDAGFNANPFSGQ